MLVYHGTTSKRAEKICENGFEPRRPSKRVWFAEAKSYADGRARTQARRTRDSPVILACEVDLASFRTRLGKRRVHHAHGVIAIDGKVSVAVVRSWPKVINTPSSPEELAKWVNRLLRLKRHQGVHPGHDGILRLSRWVINRAMDRRHIDQHELLARARQWLTEYFETADVDLDRGMLRGRAQTIDVTTAPSTPMAEDRSVEAISLLEASAARTRIRGLNQLARMEDEDAADWCAMMLGDPDLEVREAALKWLMKLEDANTEAIRPFAAHHDKRLRGAAIAAMARHDRDGQLTWFRIGLTDPEIHIRQNIANLLSLLDPREHCEIFDIARYDPNPRIQETAERISGNKARY